MNIGVYEDPNSNQHLRNSKMSSEDMLILLQSDSLLDDAIKKLAAVIGNVAKALALIFKQLSKIDFYQTVDNETKVYMEEECKNIGWTTEDTNKRISEICKWCSQTYESISEAFEKLSGIVYIDISKRNKPPREYGASLCSRRKRKSKPPQYRYFRIAQKNLPYQRRSY